MTTSLPFNWQKLRQRLACQRAGQLLIQFCIHLRILLAALALFTSLAGSAASPCEVLFSNGAVSSQPKALASLTVSRMNERGNREVRVRNVIEASRQCGGTCYLEAIVNAAEINLKQAQGESWKIDRNHYLLQLLEMKMKTMTGESRANRYVWDLLGNPKNFGLLHEGGYLDGVLRTIRSSGIEIRDGKLDDHAAQMNDQGMKFHIHNSVRRTSEDLIDAILKKLTRATGKSIEELQEIQKRDPADPESQALWQQVQKSSRGIQDLIRQAKAQLVSAGVLKEKAEVKSQSEANPQRINFDNLRYKEEAGLEVRDFANEAYHEGRDFVEAIRQTLDEGSAVVISYKHSEAIQYLNEATHLGSPSPTGAHAVVVIGYTQSPTGELLGLRVLNSWGKDWGDGGEFFIKTEDAVSIIEEAYKVDFSAGDESSSVTGRKSKKKMRKMIHRF